MLGDKNTVCSIAKVGLEANMKDDNYMLLISREKSEKAGSRWESYLLDGATSALALSHDSLTINH